MNRLEKLKNRLAEKHYKESGHVPTEWAVMNFNSGFDAASAEYEKIIAEIEGALEWYAKRDEVLGFKITSSFAIQALQKLKDFKNAK